VELLRSLRQLLAEIGWFLGFYFLPWDAGRRWLLLRKVKSVGTGCKYEVGLRVFGGDQVYIGDNVRLVDTLLNVIGAEIHIEDEAFFGHRVMLLTGTHDYHIFGVDRQHAISGKPICIGRGAWIGSGAIVLGGVCVGAGAVVAAGSVVIHDVPPFTVAAGVPARVVKNIPHG